jgi:hypothetical protein
MENKFYVELQPFKMLPNPPEVTDGRIVLEAEADEGHVAHVFVMREENLNHPEESLIAVSAYVLEVDKDGNLKLFEI